MAAGGSATQGMELELVEDAQFEGFFRVSKFFENLHPLFEKESFMEHVDTFFTKGYYQLSDTPALAFQVCISFFSSLL
jgi:hypothetical protein